jgi:D-arabinose 1-dehydrogenase-like Zn-dependent alcohol dehydrogenase
MEGKIAVMTSPENLEYQSYQVPEPEPGAIIAQVARTNVCGSELHIWRGHHPVLKRAALGHEMLGELFELGEGVTKDFAGASLAVGDRIAATYFQACRKCGPCQQGQFNLCVNAYEFWTKQPEEAPHFHATFATHYYIHPDQYVYKVPDNVPNSVAASANCALSQVYYGLEQANLVNGQTLVIQGAGGLGLYATAVAKDKGARVIVVDAVVKRLKEAEAFGADEIVGFDDCPTADARIDKIQSLTDKKGADVVLEVAGVPQAFAEGLEMVRAGGTYVGIGNVSVGQTTEVDPGLLARKSMRILPIVRYQPWYLGKALAFLSRTIDRFPFREMLDSEFSLDNVEEALNKSASREVIRASIVNNE